MAERKNTKIVDQADALDLYMDALFDEESIGDGVEHSKIDNVELPLQPDLQPGLQKQQKQVVENYPSGESQIEVEAPKVDLSLFLPNVPSTDELDIIEKKQQKQINQELNKQLVEFKEENKDLKLQLTDSLKKLDDYTKTHTEVYAPDWANPSFQIMLFDVGNLKLAIPLNELSNIVVWDEKYINQMPGSKSWYLGLIQHMGKSVPIIDTLQQVVPPQRIEAFNKKRGKFKHIIFIDDGNWGLVCEKVIGIKTLAAEEVKWRSDRTSRRWLMGTVKEQMCALLDTGEFASMLRTGDGSFFKKKST